MEIEVIENIDSVLPIFEIKGSNIIGIPNTAVPIQYKIRCDTDLQSSKAGKMTKTGGGFGNPESNRLVETAAIKFVTTHYQESGWSVESYEDRYCGYDLHCTKDNSEEHVEVKGIKGDLVSFIITEGEVECSEFDEFFVLCAVTTALDNPKLHRFTAKQFREKFNMRGRVKIEYHASLR